MKLTKFNVNVCRIVIITRAHANSARGQIKSMDTAQNK